MAKARSAARELAGGTIACSPLARGGREMRGRESQEAGAGAMALHHRLRHRWRQRLSPARLRFLARRR